VSQLALFDQQDKDVVYALAKAIRPANMRTVHGIRDEEGSRWQYSVSVVQCVEETLHDGQLVRISGGGMDAPEDLPTGSVKAFFSWHDSGLSGHYFATGFCQRTAAR